MKEMKMFNRRYSAVSTEDDTGNVLTHPNSNNNGNTDTNRMKSLKATRGFANRLNIVNSFFRDSQDGQRTRWPKCAFLLLAGGLLAITAAVLVKIFQPYDLIFKWKLVFGEGGEIFNLWEKPPVDLYIKIYLFNITNTEAFLAGREKIKFEEVGPYVYKELMTHEDVVFNDNGTVSTNPKHPLVWQEHLSGGLREDDQVMMLNIALLSIAQVGNDKSFFTRLGVNILIGQTDSQPIIKMTAKEFMFGYSSTLTTLGNTVLPGWIYFDKVGLIDRMYDFNKDYETFHTGEDDPSISGLYATYQGSPNLPQWDGEHCSNINLASDGTKFKSGLEENDTVLFFRKSMCRPQRLRRVGEKRTFGSLDGYRYIFEENAFDNGQTNEENKCFCRKGYCQPRGLIDVTDCYYGFPISLSYPHFMDSDPGLLANVTGLLPDPSQHSSYFNIQPESGLPLTISVKIQINMHMRNVAAMRNVEQFSHTTFPMLWFEITMNELPKSLDMRFNFYLNILPYIDILGFWGCLTIGVGCLLFAITRATMKLPQIVDIADKTLPNNKAKYNANLKASSVYQPCEVKLIELNEKCIRREGNQLVGPNDDCVMMCDMDMKMDERCYMLQSAGGVDDDDGAEDGSSRRSSEVPSTDEDMSDPEEKPKSLSRRTSNVSSAIDDIGNDHFPELRITEEGDVYDYSDDDDRNNFPPRRNIASIV